MRLFIAIELSEELKNALVFAQNGWRRARVSGNYTPPENLHLTLAFIGEYPDPDKAARILEKLSFAPFELSLTGFGSFGGLWWAGVSDSPELKRCAARLRKLLADAGVPFDRRNFSPHVTLIREPSAREIPPVTIPGASMTVGRVSLMRSDRGKHGMIYTEISSVEAV